MERDEGLVGIIIAILVFGLIIFIHELGHFLVAKAAGIRVQEFALGMGPTLFHFTKGETKYALRLLPIGGFCQMEGEDSESEDNRAFCNKKVWVRICVVAAGAVMNLILGFIVVLIMVSTSPALGSTTVSQFSEGATTQQTGLQEGDTILKVKGRTMFISNDIVYEMLNDSDGIVDMVVLRDGKKVKLDAVQFQMKEENGQRMIVPDFVVKATPKTFLNVLNYTFRQTASTARLIWVTLIDLVTGRYGLNDLSGPVGVIDAIGQAASIDISALLNIVAFITINVGIFNLLPLPALDGGRLVFLIIEAIRRKPIKPQYEGYVHFAGMILLFLLMIFVTINDILRLF